MDSQKLLDFLKKEELRLIDELRYVGKDSELNTAFLTGQLNQVRVTIDYVRRCCCDDK